VSPGCVMLKHDNSPPQMIAWLPSFHTETGTGAAQVVNRDGATVAAIGDHVHLGGGPIPAPRIRTSDSPLPQRCVTDHPFAMYTIERLTATAVVHGFVSEFLAQRVSGGGAEAYVSLRALGLFGIPSRLAPLYEWREDRRNPIRSLQRGDGRQPGHWRPGWSWWALMFADQRARRVSTNSGRYGPYRRRLLARKSGGGLPSGIPSPLLGSGKCLAGPGSCLQESPLGHPKERKPCGE
jgi:hypothetical protein